MARITSIAAVGVIAGLALGAGAQSAQAAPGAQGSTVSTSGAVIPSGITPKGNYYGSLNDLMCQSPVLTGYNLPSDPMSRAIRCSAGANPAYNARLKSIVARSWGNASAADAWQREAYRRAVIVAVCEKATSGYYEVQPSPHAGLLARYEGRAGCLTRNNLMSNFWTMNQGPGTYWLAVK